MNNPEFEIAERVTPAPVLEPPAEYKLLAGLEDAGAIIPDDARAAVLEAIETALDTHGDQRAATALRWILDRLPGGRRGAELRAALLGAVDGDGQSMADQFGTTKQSWHQRVDRLREAILKKR